MTTYVYINTVSGQASPSTKFYTTPQDPAPTGLAFNTLANAELDASIRARTDDIIFTCVGATDDGPTTISNNLLGTSVTVIGDVVGPKWDDNAYTIAQIGAGVDALSIVVQKNITVKNVQVTQSGNNFNARGVSFAPAAGSASCTLDGVICRIGGTGGGIGYGMRHTGSTTSTWTIRNCIVYLFNSPAIVRDGITGNGNAPNTIYNSIVYGFSVGAGVGMLYFDTVKNCAVFNNTTDYTPYGGDILANNASDDGFGTSAVVPPNWALEFVNPANGDFTPVAGGTILDAGIGPSADAAVPALDIAGNSRSGATCDIGSAQLAAQGVITIGSINGGNAVLSGQLGVAVTGTLLDTVTIAEVIDSEAKVVSVFGAWSATSPTAATFTCPTYIAAQLRYGSSTLRLSDGVTPATHSMQVNAPAGFGYDSTTTLSATSPNYSLWRTDAGVLQVVIGEDQCEYETRTDQNNGTVVVGGDGHYTIDPDTAYVTSQVVSFGYRFYDKTDRTWGAQATVTVTVNAPGVAPPTLTQPLPDATVYNGSAYSGSADDYFAGATSYTSTAWPPGLSMTSAGVVSGTYTGGNASGTVTITAINSGGTIDDTMGWTGFAVAPQQKSGGSTAIGIGIAI